MRFAVAKLPKVGRDVAKRAQPSSRPRRETAGPDAAPKFGALVPTAAPRRDDRDTGPDHGSAPFVAQLIASRTGAERTRLELRLLADRSAAAYRTAEALPYTLPTGLYLRHSL